MLYGHHRADMGDHKVWMFKGGSGRLYLLLDRFTLKKSLALEGIVDD